MPSSAELPNTDALAGDHCKKHENILLVKELQTKNQIATMLLVLLPGHTEQQQNGLRKYEQGIQLHQK